MSNNNTIAGWVLAGGIAALGFSIVSGKYFHAGKHERPEVMGYVIEGVETSGGADSGPSIETLLQTADAAAGEKVFGKCAACHTINQGGANGIGPNLYAAMGKPHGHVAGFAYSDALKSIPGNWDWTSMDAWLTSPRKYAPGTKMTFAGLGKAEDRANLMAYLNAQGSNLPLPAAPVVEEAPAEGEEAPTAADEAPADAAAPEAVAAEPAPAH
jgi:cytochrome c